jgi:hypothetical protein
VDAGTIPVPGRSGFFWPILELRDEGEEFVLGVPRSLFQNAGRFCFQL